MSITVKASHLEVIMDITNRVIWYKQKTLSSKSYATFENIWLVKLVEQIDRNEFTWHDRNKNTATWLIDQVCHSNIITPGIKPKYGVPLADTELGQQALDILRAMSKGQDSYDSFAGINQYSNLFD